MWYINIVINVQFSSQFRNTTGKFCCLFCLLIPNSEITSALEAGDAQTLFSADNKIRRIILSSNYSY